MTIIRKRYSREEKLEIVKESMEACTDVSSVAQRYGIHDNTLSRWRREFAVKHEDAFPGKGKEVQSGPEREIEYLKKQLRESELANEILKKAMGIIASPNRKNLLS